MKRSKYLLAIVATGLLSSLPLVAGAQDVSPARTAQERILGKPYNGPRVETPRDAQGHPLLTGFWKLLHEPGKPDGNLAKDQPGFRLPYTPAGLQALAANQQVIDPEARCLITGMPRLLTSVLPFEILQTPERLATFHQLSWHRWVWLDGRQREQDEDPRYLGNAIGHWEGDTLVIESSGFHDSELGNLWLDDNANPISDQAVVVERWSRPDYHHLQLQMTVTDPKYYARPFTFDRVWQRADKGAGANEYACNETNNARDHIGPGAGIIGPDGNRGFGYNAPLPDVPPGPEAYEDLLQP